MSSGWSIHEKVMSAKMSRDHQYFHHSFLKYLRWATFVLNLRVTAFIISVPNRKLVLLRIKRARNEDNQF